MYKKRKLISFDWALKQILRSKANFAILEGFLSELLQDDIKINTALEIESNREYREDKSNRVDLLVENSKKESIFVEIQYESEYDYLQRLVSGNPKLLAENMGKVMPSSKIRKIISISLVYFDLGQGEDYVYHGTTQFIGLNKKDVLKLDSSQQDLYKIEKISDIYSEYYLLKINQFEDTARNTIDEWLYLLKNDEIKDEFTAKGLKEAKEELNIMNLSDEDFNQYEKYLDILHYQASMYESSYKVGEMKGEKRKALEMVKVLKENGVDVDIIVKSSGLSKEEIKAL